MQSATAQLLEMFGEHLKPGDEAAPGRFAAFKVTSWKYRRFVPNGLRGEYGHGLKACTDDGSTIELKTAEDLYREASEEQRLSFDAVLERHPREDTFHNLLQALWTDSQGETEHAFDLLVLLYDEMVAVGKKCVKTADAIIKGTSTNILDYNSDEIRAYRALFKVTATCAFDARLNTEYCAGAGPTDSAVPLIHDGLGTMWGLQREHGEVVTAHPDKADLISTAMKKAVRKLDAAELELIAAGTQSVPLIEGAL